MPMIKVGDCSHDEGVGVEGEGQDAVNGEVKDEDKM